MIELDVTYENGTKKKVILPLPIKIGKSEDNQLVIKSWRVSKLHATITLDDGATFINDNYSLLGVFVNGRKIQEQQKLKIGDELIIGPCKMKVLQVPQKKENNGNIATQNIDVLNEVRQKVPSNILRILHGELLSAMDLRKLKSSHESTTDLKARADSVLENIFETGDERFSAYPKDELKKLVINEAFGLGPLEELLEDENVSEIMVNSYKDIYVEKSGKLQKTGVSFSGESAVLSVIDRIVSPLGRRIDENSPMVDARLKDGSRVNAVIPPIALKGASINIRKFSKKILGVKALIEKGTMTSEMASFLNFAVLNKMNILISGGTGTGKTTVLNILTAAIPHTERLITIEDAAELQLQHPHTVSLESRPANAEGQGLVTIRDLLRNALRMRPDRIVVGECRGAEAFEMLSAMNTGHEGSLSTLHANSPREALNRLETMILMASMELPLSAIREHIASSVNFIVQLTRLNDGRRIISSIVEVGGVDSGIIQLQELYSYKKSSSTFIYSGLMPSAFENLRENGQPIPQTMFI
ncbi:ATPase, T2SS/T4P/T4SS family [Taylorella equigenitalis]|uniref:Pilus assembly ATPase protein n=1 Tax=Taylorella equigenitalis ATCC 35865 TaxID=743973 RepID=A0ABN4AVL4_9BURK|nr:ATPase, T2SS/T4P/T4SS family [Taylorella equigenitalis]AFN35973.1 putative pilus assembly ATPase protein [Taylorella equigenitalis ATCC 35865]ASY39381.1 secretion protein [Taylorella equigenitalis]VEG31494.1 Type IV secretion system protein virB11 [Taylorella equigenitalis ATCC 35865]